MTIFGIKMVKSGLEFFILKLNEPLQSCCCPVQKIGTERLNWPGRLAGISEGARVKANGNPRETLGQSQGNLGATVGLSP